MRLRGCAVTCGTFVVHVLVSVVMAFSRNDMSAYTWWQPEI